MTTSKEQTRLQCALLAVNAIDVRTPSDRVRVIKMAQLIEHYVTTGGIDADKAADVAEGLDDMTEEQQDAVDRLNEMVDEMRENMARREETSEDRS